ncbi:MAG: hypothetical protein IT386_13265 [Deltaproteobacteria bacterium]|nr:hypothetical protein [Deltaproteobacteria bacterium]
MTFSFLSRTALLFLRGRDADARSERLVSGRRGLRPALGEQHAAVSRARGITLRRLEDELAAKSPG